MDYPNIVAYESMEFPDIFEPIYYKYQINLDGLTKLKEYNLEYRLAIDLINKSKRCNQLSRYNEAILYIYRACELICKLELQEQYQLNTEKISINMLRKLKVNEKFINHISMDHKYHNINISLKNSFELLYELNDILGKFYHLNRFDINDIITIRHHSMLVHGINHVSYLQYEKYEYVVRQLIKLFDKDSLNLLSMTEFPRFEVN